MTAPTPRTVTTRESRPRGRGTSLSGGKVQTGHRVHGAKESNSDYERKNSRQARSKSREPRPRKPKARREYNTPFDDKGRCHYHVNVQLATKKFNGGWKVLCNACPKCMEQKQDSGDEKSVRSGRSGKSSSGAASGDAHGKFDNNGCCALHPHIQVAKKGFLGSGWKVQRTCPSCNGGASVGLDDDAISVKSGRSASSRKSTKSTKSRSRSTAKSGKATSTGRYGALPFDGDGYCCRHPSVQIAQKKMIGGFKIIHDLCPDCVAEDGESGAGAQRKGRNRSKSRNRHRSSSRHHRNNDHDETGSVGSSNTKKKKRIRVKNLKTEDELGKHGRYSGYVNDDHQPHGNGVMKYEDGTQYDGVWSEGSKVHGKTTQRESKSKF